MLVYSARCGTGMVTIFATIVQQEQIRGLWRGMVPVRITNDAIYFQLAGLDNDLSVAKLNS